MTKTNLFLRFTDETEWRSYATANGILSQVEQPVPDEDGNETEDVETIDQWSYFTHDHAINDIGTLLNDDGVYDPDTGEVITPPTPKPGWHVNWKASTHPADISTYVVTPVFPRNTWAGD